MNDAHFSIDLDVARSFVRITMAGLFTPDDVARFTSARDEAHAQLLCAPNQHVTLTDVRDMKIQPQDVVGAFRDVLSNPSAKSRKLAFLVPGTLTRAQLERATLGRHARFFYDGGEAEAWLFGR